MKKIKKGVRALKQIRKLLFLSMFLGINFFTHKLCAVTTVASAIGILNATGENISYESCGPQGAGTLAPGETKRLLCYSAPSVVVYRTTYPAHRVTLTRDGGVMNEGLVAVVVESNVCGITIAPVAGPTARNIAAKTCYRITAPTPIP